MPGTLYLLPNRIADRSVEETIPLYTLNILRHTQYFLAENAKSARTYLKAAEHPMPIASLHIEEIGHRPEISKIAEWLKPLEQGHDIAIVSESGCPGIADPGADIVAYAQRHNLTVKPLVGPSSILLALMASGLNGQNFRFLGYLPIKEPTRTQILLDAQKKSVAGETQIFIETPYRNGAFLAFLAQTLQPQTRITVAMDVTGDHEFIKTKTAADWKSDLPDLEKLPTIFAILAQNAAEQSPDLEKSRGQGPKCYSKKRFTRTGDFWRKA